MIEQTQEILERVDTSVGKVWLKFNAKYMSYNQGSKITIQTNEESQLDQVTDFKYLGCTWKARRKRAQGSQSNSMGSMQ